MYENPLSLTAREGLACSPTCVTNSSSGDRTTTRYARTAPCAIAHRRCSRRNGQRPRRPVRKPFRLGRESPKRAIHWRHSLESVECKNAGQTGLNRTTQAVSSTSTWYAFAGQVTRSNSYLPRCPVLGVHSNPGSVLHRRQQPYGCQPGDRLTRRAEFSFWGASAPPPSSALIGSVAGLLCAGRYLKKAGTKTKMIAPRGSRWAR